MINKKQLVKDLKQYFAEVEQTRDNPNFYNRDLVAQELQTGIKKWGNWRKKKKGSKKIEEDHPF